MSDAIPLWKRLHDYAEAYASGHHDRAVRMRDNIVSEWTAALAAQAAPVQAVAEDWRRLARQFDGQRMAAMWHLKALLADPTGHAEKARQFIAAKPADQITSAAPQQTGETASERMIADRIKRGFDVRHKCPDCGAITPREHIHTCSPQQTGETPAAPDDWSVYNGSAEVASGLSFAEAWDYLTPERLDRGWTAVCVVNKDNADKAALARPAADAEGLAEALRAARTAEAEEDAPGGRGLRWSIGRALSDAFGSTGDDGVVHIDPHDSDDIDELVNAVLDSIAAYNATKEQGR